MYIVTTAAGPYFNIKAKMILALGPTMGLGIWYVHLEAVELAVNTTLYYYLIIL